MVVEAALAIRRILRVRVAIAGGRLNMGDRFAYAVAKQHDVPLLFKGDDFGKTDIRTVGAR